MADPPSYAGRQPSREAIYESGSYAVAWPILRKFERRGLPLAIFDVGMALERGPNLARAFIKLGHEIACHGWRWINHQQVDEATEHMPLSLAVDTIPG